jgi:hypothetical protein
MGTIDMKARYKPKDKNLTKLKKYLEKQINKKEKDGK